MPYVHVPADLWNTSLMPEGVLERWLVAEGATVKAGDPVALVRISENLHDIIVPASGRVTGLSAVNSVVEPGSPIAQLES